MKYSLTGEKLIINETVLYRIKAEKDFSNVKKGELGGWIEKEDNLSQEGNSWVYEDAKVYGNACVYEDARVFGNAKVYENAKVYGDAWVYGNACVFGDAWFYGNARICAKACYKKGFFIGGANVGKITEITEKTGTNFWKKQYVLGDYEITENEKEEMTLEQICKELGRDIKIIK